MVYVIYKGLFLNYVDKDMKNYFKISDCRRNIFFFNFDIGLIVSFFYFMYMCCDNCVIKCECSVSDCG